MGKDKIDIFAILKSGLNTKVYEKLLKQYHLHGLHQQLVSLLKDTREVPEIGMNAHQCSKLKREFTAALSIPLSPPISRLS